MDLRTCDRGVGRFRQTAAELRQRLAGEASAEAAVDSLRAREGERTTDADVPKAPPVPRDLTAAAFFDVDNTLVHGASIVHFTRGLVAHNYFRYSDILDGVGAGQVPDHRQGERRRRRRAAKALSFISGRRTRVDRSGRGSTRVHYRRQDLGPAQGLWHKSHLDAGQQVWLVTATPQELAQVIAGRLGLTRALGTWSPRVSTACSPAASSATSCTAPAKAHAVRSLAIREGLNLKRCTAYSDSHNDVPMLSLVRCKAVAINPDSGSARRRQDPWLEMYDFAHRPQAAKTAPQQLWPSAQPVAEQPSPPASSATAGAASRSPLSPKLAGQRERKGKR